MTSNEYLIQILKKYQARDITVYYYSIQQLHNRLKNWAGTCFIQFIESGSRAKGTAINIASDVDYLVSLSSNCNDNRGGLQSIYSSLYSELQNHYQNVRKQNVSFRLNLSGLEVDVTPARKYTGNTNDHSIYVSKKDSWQQTNIQTHINDISNSGRTNEIKLLKIWREIHSLDFPSIYIEYLLIKKVLYGKPTDSSNLADNFLHILSELAKDAEDNPLFSKIIDPANSNNTLSDLLSTIEKNMIIKKAKESKNQKYWESIIY